VRVAEVQTNTSCEPKKVAFVFFAAESVLKLGNGIRKAKL
jgi:hypothetical protein